MFFYVYILTNWQRNVFFTGVTGMLVERILDHKISTKWINCWEHCTRLVYYESIRDFTEAADRTDFLVHKLEGRQTDFIGRFNPCWIDLSGDWYDDRELAGKQSRNDQDNKDSLLADFRTILPPTIPLFE